MIAVGLDMSLSGAGICRVTHDPAAPGSLMLDLSMVRSAPTTRHLADRSERLRVQAAAVIDRVCGWGRPDLVAIEAPLQGGTQSGSSHDRSGLWWLVIARLTTNGVPCVEVVNSQLKQHALGRGSGKDTGKDYVLSAVIRRYGHLIERAGISNDEADALVLADMAARRLGHPLVKLPATHLRAMGTVPWPI